MAIKRPDTPLAATVFDTIKKQTPKIDKFKELQEKRKKLQQRNDSIKRVRQEEFAAKKKVSDSLAAEREKKFVENAKKAGMTREQYSKYLDKQSKKPDVSSSEGAGFNEKRYRPVCGKGGCR